jgi:hypothetical protein
MEGARVLAIRRAPAPQLIRVFARPQVVETMLEDVMFGAFGVVLTMAVLETMATLTWWPWFYKNAPSLWTIEVAADTVTASGTPDLAMAEAANHGGWRPLVFKRLSDSEVAFRESLVSFRPAVGLVGLIEHGTGVVTITTRWSWLLAGMGLLAVADVIIKREIGGLFVVGVLGALLAMQRHRLNVIGRAMALQGG